MPLPIDPLRFQSITTATTTTLEANLTLCTIINNGDANVSVFQNGDAYAVAMTIAAGQGISFSASDFEVLPTLQIVTTGSPVLVSVIT
tara:strand:- start:97 stop:360 length:264 start_codon:yes stop_codon:yes gene_type:complete